MRALVTSSYLPSNPRPRNLAVDGEIPLWFRQALNCGSGQDSAVDVCIRPILEAAEAYECPAPLPHLPIHSGVMATSRSHSAFIQFVLTCTILMTSSYSLRYDTELLRGDFVQSCGVRKTHYPTGTFGKLETSPSQQGVLLLPPMFTSLEVSLYSSS